MNFEVLRKSNLKKNIIIGVVVVAVIATVVIGFTRAKYRVAQSMPLINGTVNYSLADLSIVALYIDGVEATELDSSKTYTLDSGKSACTYKDGTTIDNLTLSYDSDTKTFTISPYTTKGTKCTLYFDEVKDTTKPTISNVASSVTKTSITLTVSATDDTGVTGYYYRLGTSGAYTNSSSNSHTFSGLTAGTSYTINVYVVDAAGNESSVYSTSISTQADGQSISTILAGYNKSTRTDFSTTMTSVTTDIVYSAIDWDGTSYYFAGAPTDNWVYFAGYYWRIIRFNGDGTLRLIYNGTSTATTGEGTQIGTSAFNESDNYSYYVGLSYNTTQHGIGTNSTILIALNSWYNGLSSTYQDYIDSNAGFCSDRDTSSGSTWVASGNTFYYVAYERLYTNKSPSLSCGSSDILNIPVGLITADEVAYAGEVWGDMAWSTSNTSYYLYTNQNYWTMSPYLYTSAGYTRVFRLYSSGSFNDSVNDSFGVRPVINLKADTLFQEGTTGTSTNPYKVL